MLTGRTGNAVESALGTAALRPFVTAACRSGERPTMLRLLRQRESPVKLKPVNSLVDGGPPDSKRFYFEPRCSQSPRTPENGVLRWRRPSALPATPLPAGLPRPGAGAVMTAQSLPRREFLSSTLAAPLALHASLRRGGHAAAA